jgi:hypothetical protein
MDNSGKLIDIKEIIYICNRLREIKYIDLVGEKFSLTPIGLDFLSQLESEDEAKKRLNQLYEDIGNYFHNREIELTIDQIKELVLNFIKKNIRPLIQLLSTRDSFPTNYVMKDGFDLIFCEYVVLKAKEENSVQAITIKEILIGSIISLTFKRSLPIEEKDKLKAIEIYLDSNFLFYILGYAYKELAKPTNELFEMLKTTGFKIKIFDFTYKQAKQTMINCIGKYDNIYFPTIRFNSICYYLKGEKKTVQDIRLIVNNFQEIIANLGISIEPTGINKLEEYVTEQDLITSLQKNKPNRPRISILHDIAAIKKVKEIRKQEVDKIDEAKAIFLTVDEILFAFDLNKMGHEQNRVTIPEVFVDRLMTNVLWLIDPKTEISLESIIAACIRGADLLEPNILDSLQKAIKSLAETSDIRHKDIISLILGANLDKAHDTLIDENAKAILKKVGEVINKDIQAKEAVIKDKDNQISELLKVISGKDEKNSELIEQIKAANREKSEQKIELDRFKNEYILSIENRMIKSARDSKQLEIALSDESIKRSYKICNYIVLSMKIIVGLMLIIGFGYGLMYDIPYIKKWASIIPVIIFFTLIFEDLKVHKIWNRLELLVIQVATYRKKGIFINYDNLKDGSKNKESIELTNISKTIINIKGYKIER